MLFERVLSTNEELKQEIAALQDQITELAQRQLGVPSKNDETETARINRYLLGELERRRFKAEQRQQRRPWWQLWGRR